LVAAGFSLRDFNAARFSMLSIYYTFEEEWVSEKKNTGCRRNITEEKRQSLIPYA
jgi:hypothetical protein